MFDGCVQVDILWTVMSDAGSRWLPYSVISVSSVAIALVTLRRFKATRLSAAPPRRANGRIVTPRRPPSSPAPSSLEHAAPIPLPPRATEPLEDRFNGPLYTFKAFAIATAIVMSSATASVAGVMAYLDVRNTTEFAARMRMFVSQSMPLLTAKIYRRPTSRDAVSDDPVLLAAPTRTPQHEFSTPTIFDHDAAEERLVEAFDEGGFDAWAEAAAREMEAETEVERDLRSAGSTQHG